MRRQPETDGGQWPRRPAGEIFPEILTTLDVAQLLRYDARPGMTPQKGARMVRLLVRDAGLPTLGRVGRYLMFGRTDVLRWLEQRANHEKEADNEPDAAT